MDDTNPTPHRDGLPLIGALLLALRDQQPEQLLGQLAEVALAAREWRQERRGWRYQQDPRYLTRAEKRLALAVERVWR